MFFDLIFNYLPIIAITRIIFDIIALICVYLDAKQKNNEPMLWFFVTLFSGFIGLIFYLFSQRKKLYENINKFYKIYLIFYIILSIIYCIFFIPILLFLLYIFLIFI